MERGLAVDFPFAGELVGVDVVFDKADVRVLRRMLAWRAESR